MTRTCRVGDVEIGGHRPLAIIAGPCLLESLELGLEVASLCKGACDAAALPYIFKASFDKANRSSIHSARGPGIELGLQWLGVIRDEIGVPVTTDIHEPQQAEPVARVASLLQIPAFLCRQTDLLVAAGHAANRHGGAVNVKKGQFVSPSEMRGPVRKLAEAGCENVLLTERGTFFGYHRLVNDFLGVAEMMSLDVPGGSPPVCFDCTHSTQTPGTGDVTGGRRELAPMLARAATAAGVHALFIECHPDPERAQSDAATQLPLREMPRLIETIARIHSAASHGEP